MKLFYLKFKRELLRLCKSFLSKEQFTDNLYRLQFQVRQAEAAPTFQYQAAALLGPVSSSAFSRPIDILIPVYNGYDYINPCLHSVLENTDLPFHIYLAEDCSPDARVWPLLEQWANAYPDKITLLHNEQNCGFAKTMNRLITLTEHDCVLLNSDTEVPAKWASRLFYPIFTDNTVASCGPWTNSGSFQSFFFDNEDTMLDVPLADMDKAVQDISADLRVLFPNITGFCMAISRKAIEQIGLLDEVYGRGYYEETDWCFRAGKAGFSHRLVPNLFVYHKGRSSFGDQVSQKLMTGNRKLFLKRYPKAEQNLRYAKKDPLFRLLHFIVLGRYLSLKYPGFPKKYFAPGEGPSFLQKGTCYTVQLGPLSASVYQKENPASLLCRTVSCQ